MRTTEYLVGFDSISTDIFRAEATIGNVGPHRTCWADKTHYIHAATLHSNLQIRATQRADVFVNSMQQRGAELWMLSASSSHYCDLPQLCAFNLPIDFFSFSS